MSDNIYQINISFMRRIWRILLLVGLEMYQGYEKLRVRLETESRSIEQVAE